MVNTGIDRIDRLLADAAAGPVEAGEADAEAVGVVQDLLIGHGFRKLPGVPARARG